jgi:type II secretory pathway component PulK
MCHRRGIALIIVLAIVAILSVLVLEFSYSVWVDVYLSANYDARTQALYAAKAGVEYGIYMLRRDENVRIDWLGEEWAKPMELKIGELVPPRDPEEEDYVYEALIEREGPVRAEPRDGGTAKVLIVDEDRKIPLSMLGARRAGGRELCATTLERLIEGLHVPGATFSAVEIVEQMQDWVDADDTGPWEYVYETLPDPYLPANRPFDSVHELRLLADMTDTLLYGTAPYPEIEPGYGTDEQADWWKYEKPLGQDDSYGLINFVHAQSVQHINVNTAPREVLVACFSDNELVADEIMERRRENPFANWDELKAAIQSVAGDYPELDREGGWIRFVSQCFRITSIGEYRGVRVKVTAIVLWSKRDVTVQYYRIENVE